MSNIFSGIHTALRAMRSYQRAQLVTEHNVANTNTPGYTRQEAVLATASPYTPLAFNRPGDTGLHLGQGTQVSAIRRFSYEFYDGRLRTEMAAQKNWGERRDVLQHVEALLPSLEGVGISDRLSEFWASWQALSANPSDIGVRTALLENAQSLTGQLNTRYTAIYKLRLDQDARVNDLVTLVNITTTRLAELNKQIPAAIGADFQPNDLLDERDRLVDQLAELTGVGYHFQSNGSALLSLGGHTLVAADQAQTISTTSVGGFLQLRWPDNSAVTLTSGQIAGAITARDTDIPARLTALDSLATTLIAQVNTIHSASFGLPTGNVTGQNFFTGTVASNITVNSTLVADPTQIAAAAAINSPGDGSKALQIAQLQTALLMSSSTRTIDAFWADSMSALGSDTARAQNEAQVYGLLTDQLTQQKESVTGVSLDEEAARLIESQAAYQAAARVLTAFDQMFDTVINRMGVVGR